MESLKYFLTQEGADMVGGIAGETITPRDDPFGVCGEGEAAFSVDSEGNFDPDHMHCYVALTNEMYYCRRDWYFTFGSNHIGVQDGSLGRSFMVVFGTWGEARDKLIEEIGGNAFAFQYGSAEEAGVERFDLRQVPLQKVVRN